MNKRYMVWWHSYVDEINKEETTLKKISESVSRALDDLNKLKVLEEKGKIKVKDTKSLNPIFIEILDKSVESEVVKNPIVDVDEAE
jgi:hypothetical protein